MHRLRLALQLPKLDHPGVLRLGFSIRNLIRCITKVIGGDSFGVSWLDVEEVSKPSWQFVEYTFANVAATISLVKEFGISTAIRPGFSGFLLRICRCRVRLQLQQEGSWLVLEEYVPPGSNIISGFCVIAIKDVETDKPIFKTRIISIVIVIRRNTTSFIILPMSGKFLYGYWSH